MYNILDDSFKHGENFKIGNFCTIGKNVEVGDNVTIHDRCTIGNDVIIGSDTTIGNHCVILKDIKIGHDCKIGNQCFIKSGTVFANNVEFADKCMTTGICYLGNHVAVRTASCISRSVIIEDWTFIGAGIMSSHTRFPVHGRSEGMKDMGRQYITRIGYGCLIGSRTNFGAGVEICDYTIIGYNSGVIKSIKEPGIYVGNPAKKIAELPGKWIIAKPKGYEPYNFPREKLKKYLPHYSWEKNES